MELLFLTTTLQNTTDYNDYTFNNVGVFKYNFREQDKSCMHFAIFLGRKTLKILLTQWRSLSLGTIILVYAPFKSR